VSVTFHPLRVAEVRPETDDAVSITFEVPPSLAPEFRYLPGQHVTVRAEIDGRDIRRSYSICANAASGVLRIGVKRLAGGAFSTFATSRLAAGDVLEVTPPTGEFTIAPDPRAARHYCAIAAGSGITPVLSLVSTTLQLEPGSHWTVVLGNRQAGSIMFLEDLEGLKDRYPDRLHLVHVLSREDLGLPLFSGRLDSARLEALFDSLVDPSTVDEWFLCGPFDMVQTARAVLSALGVEGSLIHDELFFAGPIDAAALPPEPEAGEGTVTVELVLEGRRSTTRMLPGTSILDAALRVRRELPYSCKGGMCASCKARLVEGEARMDKNYALIDREVEAGFILTCQAHPVSDRVVVDFDRR
jgi:ring-1,2-phenylacetyl-CoA epoxidase subunit PaaE